MINRVELSGKVRKLLPKLPPFIVERLFLWTDAIEDEGLEEVRKIPGYHDEPLHVKRAGQRSVRLNRAYRAIYVLLKDGGIELVWVEEVTKHAY